MDTEPPVEPVTDGAPAGHRVSHGGLRSLNCRPIECRRGYRNLKCGFGLAGLSRIAFRIQFGDRLARFDRIVEINQRVAQWKVDHPELVKDEIPF